MNTIRLKGVLLYLLVSLSACAAAPKPMNPLELMVKSAQCFTDHDPAVTIYTVPSHGAIADRPISGSDQYNLLKYNVLFNYFRENRGLESLFYG